MFKHDLQGSCLFTDLRSTDSTKPVSYSPDDSTDVYSAFDEADKMIEDLE